MEFVLAILPPKCESSYEHVKGTIHREMGAADFLGPSAARNLIVALPSRFSNIIFVSYNREGHVLTLHFFPGMRSY